MTEGLLPEGHYQAKSRSCLLAQNMAMILPSHQVILWKAFSHIFHLLSIPSLMFIDLFFLSQLNHMLYDS
jgi:hypothetical protein